MSYKNNSSKNMGGGVAYIYELAAICGQCNNKTNENEQI